MEKYIEINSESEQILLQVTPKKEKMEPEEEKKEFLQQTQIKTKQLLQSQFSQENNQTQKKISQELEELEDKQAEKLDQLQEYWYEESNEKNIVKCSVQQKMTYATLTVFFDFQHDNTTLDGYSVADEFLEKVKELIKSKFEQKIGIKYLYLLQCQKAKYLVQGWIQFAQLYQTYFPISDQLIKFNNESIRTVLWLHKWIKYPKDEQQQEFLLIAKQKFETIYHIRGYPPFQWKDMIYKPTFCYELSQQQQQFYDKWMKPGKTGITDFQRYMAYQDNIEIALAPLMLYIAETHKRECIQTGTVHGLLEKWLATQENIRESISSNPLEKDKKPVYKLPSYIRNSQLPEHIQITEWFDLYCKYPQVKAKCLVLYSAQRNMGKTVFAKSLVSDINGDGSAVSPHLFTIVINAISKTQFNNMASSRLLIFDDLQSFEDIHKNQEQWKSTLTSQTGQLRGLYLNQTWKGLCPVIITTNNIGFVSYIQNSNMFRQMCYRVKITQYLGPPGTEPIQLQQEDPNQVNPAFELELEENQREYRENKQKKANIAKIFN